MSSSSTNKKIDASRTSRYINVYDYKHGLNGPVAVRHRSTAGYWLNQGFRVTDHHGVDLTVQENHDIITHEVTYTLIRGEDRFASYTDRTTRRTLERAEAQGTDATGRAANLQPRELTDYERNTVHKIEDCETPNCDHPVHFGGPETGEMNFDTPSKPGSSKNTPSKTTPSKTTRSKGTPSKTPTSSAKKRGKRDGEGGAGSPGPGQGVR